MAKMWTGVTDGVTDSIADDFNSSIHFDKRMYAHDIKGSMAHAMMLSLCGIIAEDEADTIIKGLEGILADLGSGKLQFDMTAEDIHMFVEQELTARIGDVGKKLHTARSRNDQVALDIRMYLRDEIDEITSLLKSLVEVLCDKANEHKSSIMSGYTHLQRAQPITFGHHLMEYSMMLLRDIDRLNDCKKRMNMSPIGCCALEGTNYNTNRRFEA
ncbi:MAG: argininosuccinate lyase, partial [Clostridia bacterium]|nr:argininosuccinate lyase [Clostridia bacterium]